MYVGALLDFTRSWRLKSGIPSKDDPNYDMLRGQDRKQRPSAHRVSNFTNVTIIAVYVIVSLTVLVIGWKDAVRDSGVFRTMTFSLQRNGYDIVPYMTDDASKVLNYLMLDDYVAVIEPHATMKLAIGNDVDKDVSYRYHLCDGKRENVCFSGTAFVNDTDDGIRVPCIAYETFSFNVSKFNVIDESEEEVYSATAICLYVRREIRTLNEMDLNQTMEAMVTLWRVNETEGQALYGSDYHDAAYFTRIHEFHSAQQDSDHMHEGVGFLPQHMKVHNLFELAMQAVDPRVTLPYWDFTIDRATSSEANSAYIFTPKMFGSLQLPSDPDWGWLWKSDALEDARIRDGRWADTLIPMNEKYTSLVNGFGTVRGSWTANPSRYVSRFSQVMPTLPTCAAHYDQLSMDDFTNFFFSMDGSPHASTHGSVAANYGCDIFDDMRENGYLKSTDAQVGLCAHWGFIVKGLYRKGLLAPRDDCTYTNFTREGVNCGYVCDETLHRNISLYIKESFTVTWTEKVADFNESFWEVWREFMCDGEGYKAFFGDSLDPSGSGAEPYFWVIHPTLERLLHAKYMIGGFTRDDWPTSAEDVCSAYECYEPDEGATGQWPLCCKGHYEDDQLLDFVTGNMSAGIGLTNKEMLERTRPDSMSYAVPYIYDNFDWSHCDDEEDADINQYLSKYT